MGVIYQPRRTTYLDQESNTYVELDTYAPGVYLFKMDLKGNSLLSTLYLKSFSGATVTVEHFNYTTDEGIEEFQLETHPVLSGPGISKVLVGNTHNIVICRITIVGGDAELSLYGTSVSTTVNVQVRSPEGIGGAGVFEEYQGVTTPGIVQELLIGTVPDRKVRQMTGVKVICRSFTAYEVLAGSVIIASGRTSPMYSESYFEFKPYRRLSKGTVYKIRFLARASNPVNSVEAYFSSIEINE